MKTPLLLCLSIVNALLKLAQNLARENMQRAQQRMKDYYDRNAKDPDLKLVRKFGFVPLGLKKGFLRSCYITGWDHTGLLL